MFDSSFVLLAARSWREVTIDNKAEKSATCSFVQFSNVSTNSRFNFKCVYFLSCLFHFLGIKRSMVLYFARLPFAPSYTNTMNMNLPGSMLNLHSSWMIFTFAFVFTIFAPYVCESVFVYFQRYHLLCAIIWHEVSTISASSSSLCNVKKKHLTFLVSATQCNAV